MDCTRPHPNRREWRRARRVEVGALVGLAAIVEELRELGHTEGLVATALLHLEQQDPVYRSDLEELYGNSLAAPRKRNLVPASIPETFGPDD
jgi:hypothetical protein